MVYESLGSLKRVDHHIISVAGYICKTQSKATFEATTLAAAMRNVAHMVFKGQAEPV